MRMESFRLDGKSALVTGGNSGIGLGIAKALAEAGARVAIAGRDRAKNERALAELKHIRKDCIETAFDVAELEALDATYQRISDRMQGIDILVNNAGVNCRGPAEQIPIAEFERVLRVNLSAPFVLAQCFARERIAKKQSGALLMIGSLMCEAARPTVAAYTASKGGIRQLVRQLAVDWAPHNIRVNGLGPGYISTAMTEPLRKDKKLDAWVLRRTPLGRWGTPEDLQGAAVFLVSEAAAFITGQLLYVDGGWLATF